MSALIGFKNLVYVVPLGLALHKPLECRVKAKDSSLLVEDYAFLDPGSNTTFCTKRLINRLGVQGDEAWLFSKIVPL